MTEATYRIQSLARGLAIVSEVAESDGELTAAELSRRIGVSVQTTYHLLHTLRQVGYVEQDSSQRYRLGRAVLPLIDGYERQFAPPAAVIRRLKKLRDDTGETCSLSAWSGDDVVLIAQEPGDHSVRVADIQVGQRGALHARASAKILLARSDTEKRERIVKHMELKKFTDHTITRRAKLEKDIDQASKSGLAMDEEELAPHVTCIAAALQFNGSDFALTILAPTERLKNNLQPYQAALLDAVRA